MVEPNQSSLTPEPTPATTIRMSTGRKVYQFLAYELHYLIHRYATAAILVATAVIAFEVARILSQF